MSKVNQQQESINKCTDQFEAKLKAWAVTCIKLNGEIDKFGGDDLISKEQAIEGIQSELETLKGYYQDMNKTYKATLDAIMKLPIGNDESTNQHYHHQCELLENIKNYLRLELTVRIRDLSGISLSTSIDAIQQKQNLWKEFNHSQESLCLYSLG